MNIQMSWNGSERSAVYQYCCLEWPTERDNLLNIWHIVCINMCPLQLTIIQIMMFFNFAVFIAICCLQNNLTLRPSNKEDLTTGTTEFQWRYGLFRMAEKYLDPLYTHQIMLNFTSYSLTWKSQVAPLFLLQRRSHGHSQYEYDVIKRLFCSAIFSASATKTAQRISKYHLGLSHTFILSKHDKYSLFRISINIFILLHLGHVFLFVDIFAIWVSYKIATDFKYVKHF